MTVTTTTRRAAYTGDGVSVAFTIPFKFLTNADVATYVNGVRQSTGVTITGAGGTSGTATFAVAPASLASVVVVGAQINDQQTDIAPNGPFPAQSVETMADKAMIGVQQVNDAVQLAIRASSGEATALNTLPLAASRAGYLLGFNATSGQPEMSTFTMTQVASAVAAAYAGAAGPLDALSFIQAGAGAVSRTAQAKARDIICVLDFGATANNGVTNATPAFQAVYNLPAAGATIRCLVPAGTYLLSTSPVIGSGCVIFDMAPGVTFTGAGNLPFTDPPVNKGMRVCTGRNVTGVNGGTVRYEVPLVKGDTQHAIFSSNYNLGVTLGTDAVLAGIYAGDSANYRRTWAENINIVKTVSGSGDNYTCGLEISAFNATAVAGTPNGADCLMGLFVSLIDAGGTKGSAGVVVGGNNSTPTAGWLDGVWIDNIIAGGRGIRIGNTQGAQAMGAGLDTRDHAGGFTAGAVVLGNLHRIAAADTVGNLRNLMAIDGSNFLQVGEVAITAGIVINPANIYLPNIPVSATATAGAATLPANPTGFITLNLPAGAKKIPYYNV